MTAPFTPAFLHPNLNRRVDLRTKLDWRQQVIDTQDFAVIPYWNGKALMAEVEPNPVVKLLSGNMAANMLHDAREAYLLGESEGKLHVAVDISHMEDIAEAGEYCGGGRWHDLRRHSPVLPAEIASLLSLTRALVIWNQRNRFCGVCGSPTETASAGNERQCLNTGCAARHFPRLDPAVIMLVTHEDKCLLGRSGRSPEGMISTLAGFVEPGESLEQAVAREVMEEVGLEVHHPKYLGSQPWPFPSALMLGFHVEAKTTEIRIDPEEIEFADWFDIDSVGDGDLAGFRLPARDSIAFHLISVWLRGPTIAL